MTPQEMGKSIEELRDNQVVQGYRLGRTESNLDRLEGLVERKAQPIERKTQAIAKLTDARIVLQSAMKAMTDTVDRCIRGLAGNGRRPPDAGPEVVH